MITNGSFAKYKNKKDILYCDFEIHCRNKLGMKQSRDEALSELHRRVEQNGCSNFTLISSEVTETLYDNNNIVIVKCQYMELPENYQI